MYSTTVKCKFHNANKLQILVPGNSNIVKVHVGKEIPYSNHGDNIAL